MNALAPVNSARLPETYEAARAALAQCSAVDECNDWADKAAALASYARQSQDDQLERMAQRIRARAIRRAGELLKQIEPAKGANQNISQGDQTKVLTRTDAARQAGMSRHQQMQAVNVANVSEDDFEEQVESPKPPTLSQLASQGTQKRQPEPPRPIIDLKGRDPREFNRALHFIGAFEDYARALVKENIEAVTEILTPEERQRLRGCINKIDAVHDRIMTRI